MQYGDAQSGMATHGEGLVVRQGEVGWCDAGLGVAWRGFLGEV